MTALLFDADGETYSLAEEFKKLPPALAETLLDWIETRNAAPPCDCLRCVTTGLPVQ